MGPLSQIFSEHDLVRNAIATVVLIVTIFILRSAVLRFVRGAEWASEQMQLHLMVRVRTVAMFLLALGFVVIWASELRTMAISVVAIAVAIVIATKELILCVSGSVLRATSQCFSVGDRIEVSGIHGDVVDLGLFTTTILETGPGHRRTGRAVVLPNGVLLSAPVINETFTDDFVLHMISVPIGAEEDWQQAEERLLAAAREVCAPILAEAQTHMQKTANRHGLPDFKVEPTVNLQVPEADKLRLILRVPSRAQAKGATEQQILRHFLRSRISPPNAAS